MEHYKISKLLNDWTLSKWIEVNGLSSGQYSVSKDIRFKTSMLRSDLCDHSDGWAGITNQQAEMINST